MIGKGKYFGVEVYKFDVVFVVLLYYFDDIGCILKFKILYKVDFQFMIDCFGFVWFVFGCMFGLVWVGEWILVVDDGCYVICVGIEDWWFGCLQVGVEICLMILLDLMLFFVLGDYYRIVNIVELVFLRQWKIVIVDGRRLCGFMFDCVECFFSSYWCFVFQIKVFVVKYIFLGLVLMVWLF